MLRPRSVLLTGEPERTERRKFYITGGRTEDGEWRNKDKPLVCYGTDRLDALSHSGITVWEADHYEAAKAACDEFKRKMDTCICGGADPNNTGPRLDIVCPKCDGYIVNTD